MIVQIDFDGTLTSSAQTGLQELLPNEKIVELVRKLYDDGNEIVVCTARGSKSCGSQIEREVKYRILIEEWLKMNAIPYHRLSFNKEYADAYIDDRAFNADRELVYEKLDGGFTGNSVRRLNNHVVKKTNEAKNELEWYQIAAEYGIKTPAVYHCDIDTITIEHIDGVHSRNMYLTNDILLKMACRASSRATNFGDYIARIERHIAKPHWNGIEIRRRIINLLQDVEIPSTFSHGDFSITNLLQRGNEIYAIDPIFQEDSFQSIYIDIAKNLFSLLFYAQDSTAYQQAMEFYCKEHGIDKRTIRILIAAESVRVSTYKKSYIDISCNLVCAL